MFRNLIAICFTACMMFSCDVERTWELNMRSGSLSFIDDYRDNYIEDPYAICISPDGKDIYVASYETDTLVWFSRSTATGGFIYKDSYSGTQLDGISSVALSPDGEYMYAVTYLSDSVLWYSRDISTGALTYEGSYSDVSFNYYKSIIVSRDGSHVYAATSSEIISFNRNSSTGGLSYTGNVSGGASSMLISPDGEYLYTIKTLGTSVWWYSRDNTTGILTDGGSAAGPVIDGALRMNRTSSLNISPDGNTIYITGILSDDIVWLNRNSITGELTYGGYYAFMNFYAPFDTIYSQDSDIIYVNGDGFITWFERNSVTGELIYIDQGNEHNEGVMAISPDNEYLYISSRTYDSIRWYKIIE